MCGRHFISNFPDFIKDRGLLGLRSYVFLLSMCAQLTDSISLNWETNFFVVVLELFVLKSPDISCRCISQNYYYYIGNNSRGNGSIHQLVKKKRGGMNFCSPRQTEKTFQHSQPLFCAYLGYRLQPCYQLGGEKHGGENSPQ